MSIANDSASLLEAHADTVVCTPAWAPSRNPTLAAAALAISIGTVSGDTRRTPFSFWMSHWLSSVCSPPIPVETTTASRSRSTGLSSPKPNPASRHASLAAMSPSWDTRSSRRASTRSSTVLGSTATVPAIWHGSSAAQSASIRLTPERPASRPSQVLATSPPIGVVAPSPVTTMGILLMRAYSGDVGQRSAVDRWVLIAAGVTAGGTPECLAPETTPRTSGQEAARSM